MLGKVSLVRWHLRSKGGDGEPAIWEEGIFLEKSFTQDRGQRTKALGQEDSGLLMEAGGSGPKEDCRKGNPHVV